METTKRDGPPGGAAGTACPPPGTNGGRAGTNGARRRIAVLMLAGLALILVAVTIGEAESMLSDFAADGVKVAPAHVWIWQVTSVLAWASTLPALWIAIGRLWPPRASLRMAAAVLALGLPLASAWHVGGMILLRKLVYAARGEHYVFAGAIARPYLYEFRKDVATYLQFVAFAALGRWLLDRVGAATPTPVAIVPPPRVLEVVEGARVTRVPVDEIEAVTAAGNYVELAWGSRALLHRATLAAVAEELGPDFARIGRSRLVRRAAIRAIETNQAGDFTVELASGARVKGSRRYRAEVEG